MKRKFLSVLKINFGIWRNSMRRSLPRFVRDGPLPRIPPFVPPFSSVFHVRTFILSIRIWFHRTKLVESSSERNPPLGNGKREGERRRMAGYREATPSLLDKQITRVLEKVAWHSLTHGCLLIAAYRKREKRVATKRWRRQGERGTKGITLWIVEKAGRMGAEVEGSGETLGRD